MNNMPKREVLIIGDGPSVRFYFDQINSIECDHIYCGHQILRKNFIKPSSRNLYYIIVEPRLFWPRWLLNKKKRADVRMLNSLTLKTYSHLKKRIDVRKFFHVTNIFFLKWRKDVRFVFTKRFFRTYKVDSTQGSYRACIALAVKLGYNHLIMVGFDSFNQKYSYPNRWFESNTTKIVNDTANIVTEVIGKYNEVTFEIVTNSSLILNHPRFTKSERFMPSKKDNLANILKWEDYLALKQSGCYNMDDFK